MTLQAQPSGQGLGVFTDGTINGSKTGVVAALPANTTSLRFMIVAQLSSGGQLSMTYDRDVSVGGHLNGDVTRPSP